MPIIDRALGYIGRGIFGILLLVAIAPAMSCGLRFGEPKSFFDGVDFQGHVHIVKRLGQLEIGETKLPIFLIFNSGDSGKSTYAGSGFRVPFLESRILAIDAKTFKFEQPDGWFQLFWRDKQDSSLLHGTAGWKAKISGDNITAWADCGTKAVFTKGKITELHLKSKKLEYIYNGDQVAELREAGAPILKVIQKDSTAEVAGLSLGMQGSIRWEWGPKPRVQNIQGKNLIGGMDQAVKKVINISGEVSLFEFGVDESTRPALTLDESRRIVWNASNRLIVKDNAWNYDVVPGEGLFSNASIKRTNEKGQTEFWKYDGKMGEESYSLVSGITRKRSWFTSGPMAGKSRKASLETRDGRSSEERWIYDEHGLLTRRIRSDGSTEHFFRDEKGQLTTQETIKGDNSVERLHYDNKGRISLEEKNGLTIRKIFYPPTEGWAPEIVGQKEIAEKFLELTKIARVEARAGAWPGEWTYYMFDKLGASIGKITPEGDVVGYGSRGVEGAKSFVNGMLKHKVTELAQGTIEQFFANDGSLKESRKTSYDVETRTKTIESQRPGKPPVLTVIKYDEKRRVVEYQSPSGTIYNYEYDETGGRKTTKQAATK